MGTHPTPWLVLLATTFFGAASIESAHIILAAQKGETVSTHASIHRRIGEILQKHGHNVTYFGIRVLNHPELQEESADMSNTIVAATELNSFEYLMQKKFLFMPASASCRAVFLEPIQTEIRNRQFDLAIIQGLMNECLEAFMYSLGTPLIHTYTSLGEESLGIGLNPLSTQAHGSSIGAHRNFLAIVFNVVVHLQMIIFSWFTRFQADHEIHSYLKTARPIAEVIRESSVHFLTWDPIFDGPRELPTNAVHLGCTFCGVGANQSIPDEVLNVTETQFIYFSMGSLAMSYFTKPSDFFQVIKTVFRDLPYGVIWGGNNFVNITDLPPNVHMLDKAPQTALLSHPNCVLFITHCGLNSVQESMYAGVRIMCLYVPTIFSDWQSIAANLRDRNLAIVVDAFAATSESVRSGIDKVLSSDAPFFRNIQQVSTEMHAEAYDFEENVVRWTHYAITTRNSSLVARPLYGPLVQDFAFLLLILLVILFVAAFICRRMQCKKLYSRTVPVASSSVHLRLRPLMRGSVRALKKFMELLLPNAHNNSKPLEISVIKRRV